MLLYLLCSNYAVTRDFFLICQPLVRYTCALKNLGNIYRLQTTMLDLVTNFALIYVDLSLYVVCSHSVGYTTRIGDFHIQHCAVPHLNMYNMVDLCTLKLHQLFLCTSMGMLLTTKNVKVSTRTHTPNASNTYARTSLL